MGAIWVKTDEGWKQGIPYGRGPNGWAKSVKGWRKTGPSTWATLFTTDLTPPGAPTIPSLTISADLSVNQGRLSIKIKAPSASDLMGVRVKVGKAVSANNTTDGNYVATQDAAGQAWSEWTMTPNQERTKTWPLSGNLTANTTYYVTAWAYDKTRNFSAPVTKSIKYEIPAVLKAKEYTGYLTPTDSSSAKKSNGAWVTGDKFVRAGSAFDYHGLWFYSTRIPAALKGVKGIEKMVLEVQRYPSGLKGKTKFKLFAHKWENRPTTSLWKQTGGAGILKTSGWFEIEQGQTLKITIPSSWYADVIKGTIKGFGILSQVSAANDVYNPAMYGAGTFSGRIYAEWRK